MTDSHLVPLRDGWSVWKWACLRGSGFPASHVDRLVAHEGASAADALLVARAEEARLRAVAIDANTALLRAPGEEDRSALKKATRALRKGGLPPADSPPPELRALLDAGARASAAEATFRGAFARSRMTVLDATRELARDPRVREAVTWQNRKAVGEALDHLAASRNDGIEDGNAPFGIRRPESLLASYIQRYCTKNDSIGFFGPVGWAQFHPAGPAVTVKSGERLLARRSVYFEQWTIDALAHQLSVDPRLEPWMRPRAYPFVRVAGTTATSPVSGRQPLTPAQLLLLPACTGRTTAQAIVGALMAAHPEIIESEAFVYEALRKLRESQLIAWAFEVPFEWYPERALRRQLDAIDDVALRTEALVPLDELENARQRIAEAAGSAVLLAERLVEIETLFTRITKLAPSRRGGVTYAGRQLVFEDCRRDVEVWLGPALLADSASALSLILTSARWFTYEVGEAYRRQLRALFEDLARRTGTRSVPFSDLWLRGQRLLFGTAEKPVAGIAAELQARWARVLALPDGARSVQLASSELAERTHELFAAPRPGWPVARYQCPDVMIAARSTEAIGRGEYQLVLGELHVAGNTCDATALFAQHPSPQELVEAFAKDVPETVVRGVNSKDWPQMTARTQRAIVSPTTWFMESGFDPSRGSRERVLASGALVVEDVEGALSVRLPSGERVELLDMFADVLSALVASEFRILPRGEHAPRVTIDKVVICRESWSFSPRSMTFADEQDDRGRFLAARTWAQANGIPRFVYVRSPLEAKPMFVDFDAPALVNVLSKLVRLARTEGESQKPMTMSEMLPMLDQTWLEDAAGERYTSELRIVCVDGAR